MEHQRAVQNLAVESYLLGDVAFERDAFEEHFECSLCGEDVRAAANSWRMRAKSLALVDPSRFVSNCEEAKGGRTPGWLVWLKPQFAVPALAALRCWSVFNRCEPFPICDIR
jgi:hypothetical protein